MADTDLAARLEAIVGPENVLQGEPARRAFTGDQSWVSIVSAAAGQSLSRQDLIVKVSTTGEVSEVLKIANGSKTPVTPLGGGSGVQGAANADRGGILLDLRGMDRIRSIDERSLTATVECGVNCARLEAELNENDLRFTHYPASAEWASIGGCITARGSGVLSSKYGKIEDHVLSLEIVLPTGEVVHTPSVPRHAAGPELAQLMVGSEGTLGIVTAATLQLRRLPAKQVFLCFAFDHLEDGVAAGREIMLSGLRPAVMRLYDGSSAAGSLEKVVAAGLDGPTFVLMCDGEVPGVVDAEAVAVAAILAAHGGRDFGGEVGEKWWENRYAFYHAPHAPELPAMWATLDVVADFSHIEGVYRDVTKAIRAAAGVDANLSLGTHFSHWYPWGSMIYARFKITPAPDRLEDALALHDKIIREGTRAALAAGAVLNDHHGVGTRLAPYLGDQLGAAGMLMLTRVKQGLDPNGVLAPGKLGLPAD
jgi:alkyldihydroxyacetonephosphate synthase